MKGKGDPDGGKGKSQGTTLPEKGAMGGGIKKGPQGGVRNVAIAGRRKGTAVFSQKCWRQGTGRKRSLKREEDGSHG